MVFCGKPSRGCATCRAKKKKCDEVFPACSLCIRTGSMCPGYRDQLSLSFRDESQHILRKVRGSGSKKTRSNNEPIQQQPKASPVLEFTHDKRGSDSQSLEDFDARRGSSASTFKYDGFSRALSFPNFDLSPSTECSSPVLEMLPARELIPDLHGDIYGFHLSPSLEDQATCFFFHNYVFTELASPYDHFACLPTLFGQAREMKALSGVMISIGAAGISNLWKDPDLMRAAQEIYSSTLQHTQSLLEDSSQVQKDQTLLVVLLLALYENITCYAPQSMRSWSRHVRGATALLSLRGEDALNDIAFLELYLHLRKQIITDCLQRRVSVPQIIIDWSQRVKKVVSEQKLWENSLEDISIQLCQLRSSIKQGIIDDDEAIHQAISINEDLESWLSDVPAEFSYTKIYDFESPENVFFGCYHIYSKTRVAFVWNHYRSLRILTNEVIIDALYSSGSVSSREAQRLASEQLFKKLTADICGSVPPFLGYQNSQKCAPVMIGMLLLWPLYTCAAQNYVSPRTRDWVILQFDRIGETMGIQLATSLARVLRTRGEVTIWDRIDADNGQNLTQEVEWENYGEW